MEEGKRRERKARVVALLREYVCMYEVNYRIKSIRSPSSISTTNLRRHISSYSHNTQKLEEERLERIKIESKFKIKELDMKRCVE